VTLSRLALPDDDRFVRVAQFIEAALATEEVGPVRKACGMFLASAAGFYGVAAPEVRVLRVCHDPRPGGRLGNGAFRGSPLRREVDPRLDADGDPTTRHLIWDVLFDAYP
jgi:hypothetical protein